MSPGRPGGLPTLGDHHPPYWGLVQLWEVVKTAWVISPEPITRASAQEGAGPKGALVPLVVQSSCPPSKGSGEQPWVRSPETALGFGYRLSPAFQVATVVTIEFRAPILSLPGLQSRAWVEMMVWPLRVGLRPWVRGSRGSLGTEKGPLRRLWRPCSWSSGKLKERFSQSSLDHSSQGMTPPSATVAWGSCLLVSSLLNQS